MKDSRIKGEELPKWNWETALKSAILVGLSLEEFEYCTPYELGLIVETFAEKKEADLKERLTLVWLGEYYHRTKYLPSLEEELKKISGEKNQAMTDSEMLQMVKRLNKQLGGTYIKDGE